MIQLLECNSPDEIEAASFAIIDQEVPLRGGFSARVWSVARRLVHTSGDITLVDALRLPEAAVEAGIAALQAGATVYTDTEMVRAGIPLRRLHPLGVRVECMLNQDGVAECAKAHGITRSRAGVELLCNKLAGSIVAIGNAPTSLLAVLQYIARGGTPPALIIGMPVGFVNAAESKELLLQELRVPSLVVAGRRGGSPLAAAAVNALACLAADS